MRNLIKKQNNSKNCFICGLSNEKGLKAEFYETDQDELVCIFTPDFYHQSYPMMLHGGISASVLDELLGRAINITEPKRFAVTVNLELKYKKPVPYGKKITAIAKITKNTRLLFEAQGEIYDDSGQICVTAKGKYMKLPIEKISESFSKNGDWFLNENENDPKQINL
jgi:uncharacterized protein (TIGR00369 family)